MTRFTNPVPKYTDQSGDFMPFGLLYFFESGTNDDKTTFADVNETIPNTQPLILNGDGSVPNCFYSGSAKVILVTNAGTPSLPVDGVQQWERDPVTSASIGAIGRVWDAVSIYDKNSVVIHDDIFYISIINANQNNNPSSTPAAWSQFDLLNRFNTNETYQLGDPVTGSNGFLYTSLINNNTGNDPTSTSGFWTLPELTINTGENILINGGFDIWQRGTLFTVGGAYSADRWLFNTSGATGQVSRQDSAVVEGIGEGSDIISPFHIRIEATSADDNVGIQSRIENVKTAENKTVTVSFRATDGIAEYKIELTQNFGAGGDPDIITTITIPAPSQWARTFATLTLPSIDGKIIGDGSYLEIGILNPANETAVFRLADIKVEIASVATTFTRAGNTLAGEFEACRRYARLSDVNTRVAEYTHEMRAAPTVDAGPTPFLYDAEL